MTAAGWYARDFCSTDRPSQRPIYTDICSQETLPTVRNHQTRQPPAASLGNVRVVRASIWLEPIWHGNIFNRLRWSSLAGGKFPAREVTLAHRPVRMNAVRLYERGRKKNTREKLWKSLLCLRPSRTMTALSMENCFPCSANTGPRRTLVL